MSTWTSHELSKIGNAEELQIASLRTDGILRKPVIIWVVRVGDDLYVRSVKMAYLGLVSRRADSLRRTHSRGRR